MLVFYLCMYVLCYRQMCCVADKCVVLQITKRMMEKKYRERITDGLQQLEQNGGQVSHSQGAQGGHRREGVRVQGITIQGESQPRADKQRGISPWD